MMQLPFPPPPGFIPPPLDCFQLVLLYVAAVEVALLLLPRKWITLLARRARTR